MRRGWRSSPRSAPTCPLGCSCRSTARRRRLDFREALARAASDFTPEDTAADDPAMMIYTSGTTGPPKGALHAHRVLLGHIPGIQLPHDFFPQAGDRFWTPADWAWAGGLLDCLLPSLHVRRPGGGAPAREVRSRRRPFALMARLAVRNAFIPPTALRMLRAAANPRGRHDISAAHGRLGRRGARRRNARMGQGGARPRDQRVLRPDRMQPGGRRLRDDRRVAAGRDRQAGAGPYGRGDPSRRHARRRRASSGRSRCGGPTR